MNMDESEFMYLGDGGESANSSCLDTDFGWPEILGFR